MATVITFGTRVGEFRRRAHASSPLPCSPRALGLERQRHTEAKALRVAVEPCARCSAAHAVRAQHAVLLHIGSDSGVSMIEADSRAHAQPRNNLGSVVVATGPGAAESILAQRVVDAQSYADADGRAIRIEREKLPLLLLLRLENRNRCLRGD